MVGSNRKTRDGDADAEKLLLAAEVAQRLGVSEPPLARWRCVRLGSLGEVES